MSDNTPKTIEIPLTKGYVAIVDECDADLAAFKWCASVGNSGAYATRWTKEKPFIRLHRLILARIIGRDLLPKELCDHRDGNSMNNTRANIRLATRADNARNRRMDTRNTTGYKGVSIDKPSGKYRAQIYVNNKLKYLGKHPTAEEAYKVYCQAAREYHGEFANYCTPEIDVDEDCK